MTQAVLDPGVDPGGKDRTRAQIGPATLRRDPWWRSPNLVAALLTIWLVYGFVHVFLGRWYWVPQYHYLTPFYSPCISGSCAAGSSALGQWFGKIPSIVPYAIVSLPFVLGFRLSCYYYRRAYYRAFWRAPAACAVREPHSRYTGETRLPLILQNSHRYFFYVSFAVAVLLTYDVVEAFHGKTGGAGFGLGTLILLVNVVFVWGYTLSCHSCRHITGGRLKNFSRHPVRYWAWTQVSKLNAKHMQFAWISLGTLMLADLYIWLLAAGVFPDPRFFN